MPQQLRIDDALDRASITIGSPETPEERQHRLDRDREKQRYELFKSYVVFIGLFSTLTAVAAVCLYAAVFDQAASPDTKRWAQTVLSAILAGAISFVVGQSTAKVR